MKFPFSCYVLLTFQETYEERLRIMQEENLINPNVNISMFYKWRDDDEGRQDDGEASKNPFLQWLQLILGITTTTPSPPLTPPTECEECSCGKINNNRIVGGTETGINQYPWMAMLLYSNRFYCGASLINDRYVLGKIDVVVNKPFMFDIQSFILVRLIVFQNEPK